MTYPPDEHILRELRIESWLEAVDRGFGEMPVTDACLDAGGRVAVGALVTLVDVACARVAFHAADPHWIATADLSVVSAERPRAGVVVAEARLARAGSKLIAVEVDLHGAGMGMVSFVRIPRSASQVDERPRPTVGERMGTPLLSDPVDSIVERMGLRPVDGGVELDSTEFVSNSFGTINGGVLGFAVSAAAEAMTGQVAADVHLRYLGQTKVGPARALATVVRAGADHAVCDVTVRDVGAADALLVRATVTTTASKQRG